MNTINDLPDEVRDGRDADLGVLRLITAGSVDDGKDRKSVV